jgi:hypothetical protein
MTGLFLSRSGAQYSQRRHQGALAMIRVAVVLASALLSACAIVKINHDGTNTIQHRKGIEGGKDLANRACAKSDSQIADIISTVNKDASLPDGQGWQLTTFKCVPAPRR